MILLLMTRPLITENISQGQFLNTPIHQYTNTQKLLLVFYGHATIVLQGISTSDFEELLQILLYKNGLFITTYMTQALINLYETDVVNLIRPPQLSYFL
jgi:hypothetical protein